MDHSKKKTYLFSIDALRVIAILAVILIHASTKSMAVTGLDITIQPFSLFLNQAARFAVPLFFLFFCFVLELNNKKDLSFVEFFKKRASRIVIPFAFWSVVYLLYGNKLDIAALFRNNFLDTLLYGTASYHLYFIPTLILFYLAFPFLHLLMPILKKPITLIVLYFIQGVLLYQDYYVKALDAQFEVRIALLSFSMFVSGMVASHYKEVIYEFVKKYLLIFIFALVVLLALIFTHVYAITLKNHTSRFIYNQYSPLNYIYTGVLTALLYFLLEKTQFLRKYFITLSKLSFFVFFIHVLIQELLWDNVIKHFIGLYDKGFLLSFWFDPLIFGVIAIISFTIAYLVHKIPWAPKLTG